MPTVQITRIEKVSDGPKPQTGPDPSPLVVVETNGGRDILELSPKVARKLADALRAHLEAREA